MTITGTQTTSLVYGEVLYTYEIIICVSFHVTKFALVFEMKQPRKNSKGKLLDHTKYQRDALNIIYSSNILLYMFRATSAHLQEDTVVCEQHMVPSLSIES